MGSLGLGAINLLRGLPFILKRTGIAQLNWFGWKFL
jgi:hypothetical protein